MAESYPKWLYHATQDPRIVETEEAHRAMGRDWAESPADVKVTKVAESDSEPRAEEKHHRRGR